MKKSRHPRPENDFTIHSVAWDRDIVARYASAGFTVPTDDRVLERFWRYLNFLQTRRFTSRIVAAKREDLRAATALRNSDLTDEGFRFIRSIEKKWSGRLLKIGEPSKESAFLEKWFAAFQNETA